MRRSIAMILAALGHSAALGAALPYPIVDTHQSVCYDAGSSIPCPGADSPWAGQDAQFEGAQASYQDLGDGTVLDRVTGLMWVQARGPEETWDDAMAGAAACRVGGHSDWRMPRVKELYSLMDFRGRSGREAADCVPYLDASVFGFAFGDADKGERVIDAQDWSADEDGAPSMGHDASVFGVNFIDGRIKAYPKEDRRRGRASTKYVRYVRGNPAYGRNDFELQEDGSVLDRASGLDWARDDSGQGLDWPGALAWVRAQNAAAYLGHGDWRLPNAKELQSLVDYRRGPDISDSPAIAPVFHCGGITNEAGQKDWPFYWTSTTHRDNLGAVYLCFGRALGYLSPPGSEEGRWMDVHGAGAQRSDPKTGRASDYPHGHGPQGDAVRILNYARLVRGGLAKPVAGEQEPAEEERRGSGPEAGQTQNPPQGLGPQDGQGGNQGGPGAGRRGPPAEAVAACDGHAEGDQVTFTTPRGDEVQGVCHQRGGQLFAVPAGR